MFASLIRYIDFARSSDARLPRMVAEIDVTASLMKRLVPILANFLKRSIDLTGCHGGISSKQPLFH